MKLLIRKIFFRLLALVGGIMIALLIAEMMVRVFKLEDHVQEVRFSRNSAGGIVGADPIGAGCRFKMSENPRLVYEPAQPPEVNDKKHRNELRILCLGDSVVDNIWRKYPITFPILLAEKFSNNLIIPWKACTVINAGVTGYNPIMEFEWYKQQWQKGEFDIVILSYCCSNDRSENRQIAADPDGDLLCANARAYIPYVFEFPGCHFLLRFSTLFRLLNYRVAPYLERWGMDITEIDFDRVPAIRNAILGLRDLCEHNGSHFLLLIVPRLYPEEREHRWIIDLAKSSGIDYIDLRPIFEEGGYNNITSTNNDGSVDRTHPNQNGHDIITDLIWRKLQMLAGESVQ